MTFFRVRANFQPVISTLKKGQEPCTQKRDARSPQGRLRKAETDKADADLLEKGIGQAEIDIMPKRVRRVVAAMIVKELGFLQTMELNSDNAVPRKIRKIEAELVAAIKHACKCMSANNDYSSDCFARSMYLYRPRGLKP